LFTWRLEKISYVQDVKKDVSKVLGTKSKARVWFFSYEEFGIK
jgi:hypothetical protein